MLSVKGKSGVFIDGSNMFWAQKDACWFLDYDKLKMHLRKAHSPSLFNFYGCVDINPGNRGYSEKAQRQLAFYKNHQREKLGKQWKCQHKGSFNAGCGANCRH